MVMENDDECDDDDDADDNEGGEKWKLRGLAMRKLSVLPFVYLSVKRVHCDKTEERSVHIFIPQDHLA